jgi:hypothetical protein
MDRRLSRPASNGAVLAVLPRRIRYGHACAVTTSSERLRGVLTYQARHSFNLTMKWRVCDAASEIPALVMRLDKPAGGSPQRSELIMISRQRSGEWLRRLADRIDHHGAPKVTNWTFTFELGNGLVFRQDGRGCPVAYLGDDEFEKAHSEAVYPAPRSWDWAWLTSEDAQAARPADGGRAAMAPAARHGLVRRRHDRRAH